MTREVIPSGAALGADVQGIDFSKPLNDDDRAFVTQAWNDHMVLRFRDQDLEDEDLIRLADEFGGSQVAGSRQYYINAGYDTKSGRVSRLPGITIVSNLDKDGNPEKENSGTGSSGSSKTAGNRAKQKKNKVQVGVAEAGIRLDSRVRGVVGAPPERSWR